MTENDYICCTCMVGIKCSGEGYQ